MTDDKTEAPTDERCTDLQTTLCDDGKHINVRNPRSGSGDVHTVSLTESGDVKGCTCKGWKFSEKCYHVETVRQSPLLTASAQALSQARVATDGGTTDVSPCPGCGDMTTGQTCGKAKCDGADEIDTTPL